MRGLAIFILAATAVAAASAHEGATGVIKERMEAMSAFSQSLKAIKAELGKGAAADRARIASAAEIVARQSGEKLVALYPEGTDHPPSYAMPEVWSERAKFEAGAARLEDAAAALIVAAKGAGDLTDPFRDLTRSCGACHNRFRQKRR